MVPKTGPLANSPVRRYSHISRKRAQRILTMRLMASADTKKDQVVVIGAGVAGLNCAANLQRNGVPVTVVEASDGVGGRVRTDVQDGFLLDRGFQIFLTSYPEARLALDYNALDLKPFYAGALVRFDGTFQIVADPFRHLVDGLGSLLNPIGSPLDKILVGIVRTKNLFRSVEDILGDSNEIRIIDKLKQEGFGDSIIDRFFRPFLGGIFFDRNLNTTSRLFDFVMKMLATGENCLPAQGIGSVAEQLASRLPESSILLNTDVETVDASEDGVVINLKNGDSMRAKMAVVATDGPHAVSILGSALNACPSTDKSPVGTCCLYFSAPEPPMKGNYLYLDGDNKGSIVNNCCVPSEVSPSYAPVGKSLVSVSVIGTRDEMSDAELQTSVLNELESWFGKDAVDSWSHLKTYRIPFAQPNQVPPTNLNRQLKIKKNLYVAGDHRTSATLDGALKSGRLVAEMICSDLKQ